MAKVSRPQPKAFSGMHLPFVGYTFTGREDVSANNRRSIIEDGSFAKQVRRTYVHGIVLY